MSGIDEGDLEQGLDECLSFFTDNENLGIFPRLVHSKNDDRMREAPIIN